MHYHHPSVQTAHVAIVYRDFADYPDEDDYGPYSHNECGGKARGKVRALGVNALMTAKVLRKHGVRTDIVAVGDYENVRLWLSKHSPTHVVVQALWLTAEQVTELCTDFPNVHFVIRCHSQIGFLQVEPRAIKILRELMRLQEGFLNLTVSSNTHRLRHFLKQAYHTKVLYLPNLYDVERSARKRDISHAHRLLRIGSFGAHRIMKNHTTAAAAAMLMARRRQSDLEFYVNSGREEGPQGRDGVVLSSLRAMFADVPWAKLVLTPWAEWSSYRHIVAHMDLVLQCSFSETFNIVSCDALSEGVPVVVGDSIEWMPHSAMAHLDDAEDIARVGSHLLWDTCGVDIGFESLEKYSAESIATWLSYLSSNPTS